MTAASDYFHAEEALGKVYDAKIIRRVLGYARPYVWLLLGALLIALVLSAVEILLPYLTKTGIDRYIVHLGKLVDVSVFPEPARSQYETRYRDKAVLLSEDRFVLTEGIIDPADRRQFEQKEAVSNGSYYVVVLDRFTADQRQSLETYITANPERFIPVLDQPQFVIENRDLKALETTIKKLIRTPDRQGILWLSGVYLLLELLTFVLTYGQMYLMTWIGQKIMFDIRTELFDHIQSLPITFFNQQPIGRLVTRVSNDVNALNELFTSIIVDMLKNVLKLAGIIVAMMLLAPRLALLTFTLLPLMVAITWFFKRRMRDAYRRVRITLAQINATLSEHISGIRVIQAFAREKLHFNKFSKINHDNYLANMYQLIVQSLFSPFVVVLENVGVALVLYYGGGLAIQNAITLGTVVAFLSYLSMFFAPIRDIAEKVTIMQSAMAASERILQILDKAPEALATEVYAPPATQRLRGELEWRNVWFAYTKEEWVLKDVSFTVKPGETVALVGATGSGKTTIINLLTKFFTLEKGSILIDGKDISEYDRHYLRRQIALVLQDVFLFAGDIRRNIRLNESAISDEQTARVAALVHADLFINKLPLGYKQLLEEGGSTLSQGQRQLLSFARALAFDPAILILDEATANIDSETEQWIQSGLEQLLAKRTSVVIAHRLSTIKKADKIIVLHHGKVHEIGDHQTLLAKKGIYYKLYQLQYKSQEKP